MRVNAYIDGFNLYHSILSFNEPRLKWLDLRLLCQKFLRDDDTLNEIYFFQPTLRIFKINSYAI